MIKKTLGARIKEVFFPPKQISKREYAAARVTKNNANWTTWPTSANWERRGSLSALRGRARQASRDDPYISKFLKLMRSNLVGPKGIQLQSRARRSNGNLNVKLNQRVEEAWWLWGHRETCTASGKLCWKEVQDLIVTQLGRDGEFLVQKIEDKNNPFGFALKVWDVNWLDETFNESPAQGNRVIMSVEVDANDRPIAYWLTPPTTEVEFSSQQRSRQRTRIPAAEMIHGFLTHDDETQTRGITLMAQVLVTAKNFHGYTEGVIQSARFASNIPMFLEQTTPDGEEYTGKEDEEGNATNPTIDVSPLAVNALPPNWKMTQFDPKQPTQQHSAFSKTILMEYATGLGIPYFQLAGDMEAVNFSSSRVGLDDARDNFRDLQQFVINTLCRNVFNAWARAAWMAGSLEVSAAEFNEILNPAWNARGWKYIDPTKDIAADVERLRNRLATPSEILAEQGTDYTDFLERWKADVVLASSYGIDIETIYLDPKQAAAGEQKPAEPDADKEDQPPATRALTNGHSAQVIG